MFCKWFDDIKRLPQTNKLMFMAELLWGSQGDKSWRPCLVRRREAIQNKRFISLLDGWVINGNGSCMIVWIMKVFYNTLAIILIYHKIMKRVSLISLGKIQLCILTIIMIFCKVNGVPLSSSFYTYFFTALAFLTFVSIIGQGED